MTKDDIIRMAWEAGFSVHPRKETIRAADCVCGGDASAQLERFAALVASAEREVWRQEREQLLTQIGVLRSQLLGVRMQFGEGATISNLAAALDAEDAVNAAAIRARATP